MRKLFAITLLAAAAAVAGDKSVEDLVKDLGHEEYQVREDATKALIQMGDGAVPALEKALKSDDVEVRMRAGRALRAIRGAGKQTDPADPKQKAEEPAAPETPPDGTPGLTPGVTSRSVSIRTENGEQVVTITERDAQGKTTTNTYRGKSLDEIREKHPEVREALGNLRIGGSLFEGRGFDAFKELDKWFNDEWRGGRDDDFWKRDVEDLRKEAARLDEWARRLAEQRREAQQRRDLQRRDLRSLRDAQLLGVRARRPEPVLDAQLQLRGRGLVVEEVGRDTLAHRIGIERFDILTELNGMSVRGFDDVGPALRAAEPGKPITAKVLRRGESVELRSEK